METAYYVAPYGNDSHSGSTHAPFLTIRRAQGEVRTNIRNGMNQDITVYMRGGLYEMDSPLRFDDRDSGRDGWKVRYCSYPGEEARLVGGRAITGWKPYNGNIWQAKLDSNFPSFYTLYVNEERIKQARLPASGYFKTAANEEGGNSSDQGITFREADLPAQYDLTEAQAFVWPGEGEWNWFSETKKIASVDWEKRYMSFETPATWPIGTGSRYFLQGSLDFLRAPGQYHLDSAAGILYYWPADGAANPNEQIIIAPSVKRLLDIQGASQSHLVQGLSFSGLSLCCTDFFREYRMMDDNAERMEHREGVVYIDHAEHIEIENCKLQLSGSCGIFLDHYAKHIAIEGNDIRSLGYCGISLNGFPPGKGPFVDAESSYSNSHNRIVNNRITHGGELIGHGCGIFLYQSGDNDISNNRIAEMPRYGISLKGMRHKTLPEQVYGIPVTWDNHWDFLHSRNNRIAYNDISEVMTDSQDGGMIEAWGPGRGNVIHGNDLHDSGIHFSFGFGIYLDDAADDFTVTNNVIRGLYSTGEGKLWMLIFSKGIGNRIYNNLLVSNPHAISAIGSQEMADEENKHIDIAGNIIYNSGYLYYFVNYSDERFAAADRNLYWREGMSCQVAGNLPLKASGADSLERNEYPLEQWQRLANGKYDKHTLIAEPGFIDADHADYRLRQDSPAYRLGWTDIDFERIGAK
ncbi:right-handed parallel beta-helix repeat-containing protein [Paenibacillus sp. YIM B09110]|uniref:right-handed parallel beta-helix repeat-containing protein n=1 Tax=Paenibacillus sp. YIM B09110 TaxID=3126102 RepID=UPI00301CF496